MTPKRLNEERIAELLLRVETSIPSTGLYIQDHIAALEAEILELKLDAVILVLGRAGQEIGPLSDTLLCQLRDENSRLREALERLVNEASGCVKLEERQLRMLLGNTNVKVLQEAIGVAKAALSEPEGVRAEPEGVRAEPEGVRAEPEVKREKTCEYADKCHGSVQWCEFCGDVGETCDQVICDTHTECDTQPGDYDES